MSQHEEFPELTPEALAAYHAAVNAVSKLGSISIPGANLRRVLAASLREAMERSESRYGLPPWDNLAAIADSLHIPPPTPPTLAQAREAARRLGGEDAAIVHAFLATLGEGQP